MTKLASRATQYPSTAALRQTVLNEDRRGTHADSSRDHPMTESINVSPYSSSIAVPAVYPATPTGRPHTSTVPFSAPAVSAPAPLRHSRNRLLADCEKHYCSDWDSSRIDGVRRMTIFLLGAHIWLSGPVRGGRAFPRG